MGGQVELDFREELLLLLAPVLRYMVVEIGIDPAIQFVHVQGVEPVLETIVLGPQPRDCGVVFLSLVRMAGVESFPQEGQDFVIEVQTLQEFRKFLRKDFFTYVRIAAISLEASAMR
jgi:hypothetical protein